MHFSKAIVRIPGSNFSEGLTTADLGIPDYPKALVQHERYVEALHACGLEVTILPPDLDHPDSTFVEDAAILTPNLAILTRPGAPSRIDEVRAISEELRRIGFPALAFIEAPGTVDGGDICEAGTHYFLGLSARSNEEGLRQLSSLLADQGYGSTVVDIRHMSSILHLKSGVSFLGDNTLAVMDEMAHLPAFRGHELVRVHHEESYAANAVRINDRVLVPEGFPRFRADLESRGFQPLPLAMSEFQKMDGGLSCLSLRF